VPRGPAVDGGAFFGSLRHPHLIEGGARIRRAPSHPRRVPNSYHRPHSSAVTWPASDATPHQPHSCTRTSPPGRHPQSSGASLQRSSQGPLAKRENLAGPSARQATHRVNRQGQAGLHIQRSRLQEHRLQPCTHSHTSHTTSIFHPPTRTYFITASTYPHYVLYVLKWIEEKEDAGNIGSEFENVSYECGREDRDCEECKA
jgi:hypothetical protein